MVSGIAPGQVPGQPAGDAGSSGWLGMGMVGGQGQRIGIGLMRGRPDGAPASGKYFAMARFRTDALRFGE